jgi:hypothetical protein
MNLKPDFRLITSTFKIKSISFVSRAGAWLSAFLKGGGHCCLQIRSKPGRQKQAFHATRPGTDLPGIRYFDLLIFSSPAIPII